MADSQTPPPSVYFLGIAGAGMSALASMLKSEGWEVSGADQDAFPPVTTYLDAHAIPWRAGFDARVLPERIDVAIVGSSAKLDLPNNPEFAELQRRGVRIESFASFLGEHTAARETTVVAGSFGKSTVTALLAHIARQAGRDVGWFVGAAPLDLPSSGHSGADPVIFIEGDEYLAAADDRRPKFLLYRPRALVLTSIVHDHVNVFPTMAAYEAAFAALIERLPIGAPLVCARGFEPIARLTAGREVVWYGAGAGPGWGAADIRLGETTAFDLVEPGGRRWPLVTPLLGRHNIENIVGAAAFLIGQDLAEGPDVQRAVPGFHGLERRLDRKTRRSSAPVYEGFGSSYEKARSAVEAVRAHFPDRPLLVAFEPHAFSWRDRAALAWYDSVFEGVDKVVLLPPPAHGAATHAQSSQDEIVERIGAAGVEASPVADGEAALAEIERSVGPRWVILLLSSGPLGGLPASLPPRMDARFG